MSMVYCRGCAKEIHETAPSCPHCGCLQHSAAAAPPVPSTPTKESAENALNKKFHLTMMIAAAIAVLLLYTTKAIPLIGVATGLCFGASVRLFMIHKKNDFVGTKKLDWMLLAGFSTVAFILMLVKRYDFQGLVLIFVAVRSLVMYFKMYSEPAPVATDNKN